MPQISIEHTTRTHLYIWHITESIEQLKSLLPTEKTVEANKMSATVHQKQFLVKQILLQRYDLSDKIDYLDSGKPVCSDGRFISISHSGDYVVVAVSSEPVGIDIERKNPKLHRIASRFVHAKDVSPKDADSLAQLQYLWTAKESIYKLAGVAGLSFKQEIRLTEFGPDNIKATALLREQKTVDLFFYELEPDYLLCVGFYFGKY